MAQPRSKANWACRFSPGFNRPSSIVDSHTEPPYDGHVCGFVFVPQAPCWSGMDSRQLQPLNAGLQGRDDLSSLRRRAGEQAWSQAGAEPLTTRPAQLPLKKVRAADTAALLAGPQAGGLSAQLEEGCLEVDFELDRPAEQRTQTTFFPESIGLAPGPDQLELRRHERMALSRCRLMLQGRQGEK